MMSPQKIINKLKRHSKFMITTHINSEGDALGSELALASLLSKLGKTAYIVNNDKPPINYNFLPGSKKIYSVREFCRIFYKKRGRCSGNRPFEAAIVVDCPDKTRTGAVLDLIDNDTQIINIDHHAGNKNFGQINLVDTRASSSGELIYRLYESAKVKLDKKDALNLYTAILTDTGSFRYSNTTSETLRISSELLKFGIEPVKIYGQIYERNSVRDARLLAKIISRMSFSKDGKIAWVKIRKDIYRKIEGKAEILDRILDFARSISTIKVVVIFCQQQYRYIKVSLRSKAPLNVQRIALAFGGGGHKFASGCVMKASLKEAEKLLLGQVKRMF